MKIKFCLSAIILVLAFSLFAFCQQDNKEKSENKIRQYWFVLLTKGLNRNQDSATRVKIQKEHLANINRLYQEGKLKVAGPFGDDSDLITTGWEGILFLIVRKEKKWKIFCKPIRLSRPEGLNLKYTRGGPQRQGVLFRVNQKTINEY